MKASVSLSSSEAGVSSITILTDSRFLGGGGGEGERGGDSASSSAVSESESGGRNSSRSCRRRSLSLSVLRETEEVTPIICIHHQRFCSV